MALQKEIWLNSIVEDLFADNSFLSKSFSADAFVYAGKSVHIPNAGGNPKVVPGPIARPKNATAISDADLKFDLKEFFVEPIYIENADKYELSYDKRNSVIQRSKNALEDAVAKHILTQWIPTDTKRVIATSGDAVGTAKALTRKDILSAQTKFNSENIPQTGRYLLLPATMYEQLLADLTEVQTNAFLASTNASRGVIGTLYGFEVMLRSEVGGTADAPIALAWHSDYVCRAKGEHEAFVNENDPAYYGDVLSFMVRCGGSPMSNKGAGTLAIKSKA